MLDLLTPYRMLALAVVMALIVGGSFYAGWTANGWKLDASHTKALAAKQVEIQDLQTAINNQNFAVQSLHASVDTAEQLYQQAKRRADLAQANDKARQVGADAIKATNCATMIQQLKSLPR